MPHFAVGGGGAEAPDASAPMVVRGRLVRPTADAVHAITACTVVRLRLVQEPHRKPGETLHRAVGVGFSGGHDKNAGHVVGAVTVLGPGFGEARVLEGAATVCQPQQMVEVGRRCRGRSYQRPPLGQ